MHPEHPDPEAAILWMRQLERIKGIKLHGQMAQLKKRGIMAWMHAPSYRFFIFLAFIGKNGHENSESGNFQYLQSLIMCGI